MKPYKMICLILPFIALFNGMGAESSQSQTPPKSQNKAASEVKKTSKSKIVPSKNAQELVQCNVAFEERKGEIAQQLKVLEEKKQSLSLLQKASDDLFTQRENAIKQKEKDLEAKLKNLQDKRKSLEAKTQADEERMQKLIAQNNDILRQIQEQLENKIAQTYAKMRDSKAAAILSDLPSSQAASILSLLKPQDMGKILAKMDPQKAAELTQTLKKGPPFTEEKKPSAPADDHSPKPQDEPELVPGDTKNPSQNAPII